MPGLSRASTEFSICRTVPLFTVLIAPGCLEFVIIQTDGGGLGIAPSMTVPRQMHGWILETHLGPVFSMCYPISPRPSLENHKLLCTIAWSCCRLEGKNIGWPHLVLIFPLYGAVCIVLCCEGLGCRIWVRAFDPSNHKPR